MKAVLYLSLFLLSLLTVTERIAAQKNPELEEKYRDQLLEIDPAALPYFEEGNNALYEAQDLEAAEKAYRRVLEIAPDFAPALRRLSYVVQDSVESLMLARRSLDLEENAYNLVGVIQALVRFSDEAHRAEALEKAKKLDAEYSDEEVDTYTLIGFVALSNGDEVLFHRALSVLRRVAPGEMVTHYFAGISAVMAGDWRKAQREILRAKELGLPPEMADEFLAETGVKDRARQWRFFRYALYACGGWIAGLVILFAFGVMLSRMTLATIDRMETGATTIPSGAMLTMRRIYRGVLALTSVYFYLSLPFVFALVLAVGGGLIYAFLAIGVVPIKLVVIIAVLVLVTLFAMLKSLFTRVKDVDPGPKLAPEDAPQLFSSLREVADKIGTRPVDTVFVTPDASIGVYERGSFLKKMSGGAERCLILGVGSLEGMKRSQLKSILAHEYGHFSNKDTAGGDLALHVRRSVLMSAQGLAKGGAGAWYNPAWLFLNLFHRIYLRVSQGASRLQEVLADRWAALTYGSRTFAEGLRHVVRRSIEFGLLSDAEIVHALKEDRSPRNFYTQPVPEKWGEDEDHPEEYETPKEAVESMLQKALADPGDPFASHPPPAKRIEWVDKLHCPETMDASEDGNAWSLFSDAAKLQEDMVAVLNERVQGFLRYQAALREQMASG